MSRPGVAFAIAIWSLWAGAIGCGGKRDERANERAPHPGKPAAQTDSARKGAVFPRLFPDKISRLTFEWGGHTITLTRARNGWRVEAPFQDAADPRAIAAVLRELERLEPGHAPVTQDRAAWARYKVTPAQVVTLRITHAGTQLAPLHIGTTNYARIGDSADVYSTLHVNRFTFSRPPAAWRDRQVLRFDAAAVTALELVDARGRRARATRTAAPRPASRKEPAPPDVWTLTRGSELAGKLDPAVPNIIYLRLHTLTAVDLASAPRAETGVDTPRFQVIVHLGKLRHTLRLGARAGKHVHVNASGDPRVWLVRASDVAIIERGIAGWGKPL